MRDGAAGPLVFAVAKVRVWVRRNKKPGPPVWLLVRRSMDAEPEGKYYLCHAEDNTPLETFPLVLSCRFRMEEYLEESKSYLGMADYEGRSWTTRHHHMIMVALAHLLVTQTRMRLKKTPDLALRVLQAALPRPMLSATDTIAIIEYHLKRNRIAQRSHHKKWNHKHKDIKYKLVL